MPLRESGSRGSNAVETSGSSSASRPAFVVSDPPSEPTSRRPDDELPIAELGIVAQHPRVLVLTKEASAPLERGDDASRRRRGARLRPHARVRSGVTRLSPAPPAARNSLPSPPPTLPRLRQRDSRPAASGRSRLVQDRRTRAGRLRAPRTCVRNRPPLLPRPAHARARRQGAGPIAALATKLRPALVVYAHQHRPHASATRQPALIGLGSFNDGKDSAVILDSAETDRLVRALRHRQTAAQLEAAGPGRQYSRSPRSRRAGSASRS